MIQIPQANKTQITIYSYWKDSANDFAVYKRTYLKHSHFIPEAVSDNNKTGSVVTFDAQLLIYDVSKFKTFSEFQGLSYDQIGELWTLNPGTPKRRDQSYVLLGNIPYEFVADTVSGIDAQVEVFKKQYLYDNYRSVQIAPKFVGSPRMWHVEAGLKRTV